MWGAAILGFLQAIPELVGALRDLRASLISMQNAQTTRRIDKIQDEVNVIITRIKNEEDRQKLLDLARALNDAVSK